MKLALFYTYRLPNYLKKGSNSTDTYSTYTLDNKVLYGDHMYAPTVDPNAHASKVPIRRTTGQSVSKEPKKPRKGSFTCYYSCCNQSVSEFSEIVTLFLY